ncbi:SRPBCC family protein [Chloroflexota bacterium]
MIHIEDSIEVKAAPNEIYEFLVQCMKDKEAYKKWHPEHVDIYWIKGQPLEEGSVFCAEEYLQDNLHKLKFRIVKNIPNQMIEYRPLFPLSIIATGNVFSIEPKGKRGCIFSAKGHIRFPLWIFNRMHKAHPGKLTASIKHIREEGENLKKALEEIGK